MNETKKCQNAVQVEKDGQMQFTARKIELVK